MRKTAEGEGEREGCTDGGEEGRASALLFPVAFSPRGGNSDGSLT